MEPTTIIALYGAIVATLVALCQIHVFLKRRAGRIKVIVRDNMVTWDDDIQEGPFVMYTAVNDGEKPVKLDKLALKVRGASKCLLIKCPLLPVRLVEGEEFNQCSPREQLISQLRKIAGEPPWTCTAVVFSTADREYPSKPFKVEP